MDSYPMFMDGRLNIVKMAQLPKAIYKFIQFPSKSHDFETSFKKWIKKSSDSYEMTKDPK